MVIVNDKAHCRPKGRYCYFGSQSEKIVLYSFAANICSSIRTVTILVVTVQ